MHIWFPLFNLVQFKSYVETHACFCVFVYGSPLISALLCFCSQKFQGLLRGALKDKLVADTLVALSKQLTPVKSLMGSYFLYETLFSLQDWRGQHFSLLVINRIRILIKQSLFGRNYFVVFVLQLCLSPPRCKNGYYRIVEQPGKSSWR